MTVSMKDVRKVLESEEPDYAAAAALGPASLPHLRKLVAGDDPMLASKAAYAASLLEGDQGQDVVLAAARSDEAIVRVAAASAARNLPSESASRVLMDLVEDLDPGVSRVARSSISHDAPDELVARARAMPEAEEEVAPSGGLDDVAQLGTAMPGEPQGTGLMPGEGPGAGLMPGEELRSAAGDGTATGRMPGEPA